MQTTATPYQGKRRTAPDQAAIAAVIRAVARASEFHPLEFLAIKRPHDRIAYARARTMAIATVAAGFPHLVLDQLGEIFHRDSSSIYYTLNRHAMLLATSPGYQALHARVQQALRPGILGDRHDCGSGHDYGICPACKRGHGYPMAVTATPTTLP